MTSRRMICSRFDENLRDAFGARPSSSWRIKIRDDRWRVDAECVTHVPEQATRASLQIPGVCNNQFEEGDAFTDERRMGTLWPLAALRRASVSEPHVSDAVGSERVENCSASAIAARRPTFRR